MADEERFTSVESVDEDRFTSVESVDETDWTIGDDGDSDSSGSEYDDNEVTIDGKTSQVLKKVVKKAKTKIKPLSHLLAPSLQTLRTSDEIDEDVYQRYSGKNLMIVIRNKNFKDSDKRPGSQRDAQNIRDTFSRLGFIVKIFPDLSAERIDKKLRKARQKFNHSDASCFACVILSHGEKRITNTNHVQEMITGQDEALISVEHILEIFNDENCPDLKGKPRLFFIQACRGPETVGSVDVYQYTETSSTVVFEVDEKTPLGETSVDFKCGSVAMPTYKESPASATPCRADIPAVNFFKDTPGLRTFLETQVKELDADTVDWQMPETPPVFENREYPEKFWSKKARKRSHLESESCETDQIDISMETNSFRTDVRHSHGDNLLLCKIEKYEKSITETVVDEGRESVKHDIIDSLKLVMTQDNNSLKTELETKTSENIKTKRDITPTVTSNTENQNDCGVSYNLQGYKDLFVMFASPPGTVAYTRKGGSIFISALCYGFQNYSRQRSFLSHLTKVSLSIAEFRTELNHSDVRFRGKQVIPCIHSWLTKDLKF